MIDSTQDFLDKLRKVRDKLIQTEDLDKPDAEIGKQRLLLIHEYRETLKHIQDLIQKISGY